MVKTVFRILNFDAFGKSKIQKECQLQINFYTNVRGFINIMLCFKYHIKSSLKSLIELLFSH